MRDYRYFEKESKIKENLDKENCERNNLNDKIALNIIEWKCMIYAASLVNWDFKLDDDEGYVNANKRTYYKHILLRQISSSTFHNAM